VKTIDTIAAEIFAMLAQNGKIEPERAMAVLLMVLARVVQGSTRPGSWERSAMLTDVAYYLLQIVTRLDRETMQRMYRPEEAGMVVVPKVDIGSVSPLDAKTRRLLRLALDEHTTMAERENAAMAVCRRLRAWA
jgi:hypothetical protein